MKILIIHNTYRYEGGEETYIRSLAKILRSNGHEVLLYMKNSSEISSLNGKIRAGLGLFWNNASVQEMRTIIDTFKPDVAQTQNIFPLFSPSIYHVLAHNNIPIVQRISNYRLLCPKSTLFRNGHICELCIKQRFFLSAILFGCYGKSRIASLIYSSAFYVHKYILRSFDLVDAYIFPSKFIGKYIPSSFPLNKKRVFHLPSPAPIVPISSTSKKMVKNYFLYAGRVAEEKGIMELITVFSRHDFQDKMLYIVGDGPDKVKALQKANGVKNIIFFGQTTKRGILKYMSRSIAVLITSKWYDVQPNVVLEALSLKIPVIAPKQPNFQELINKDSGYLYRSTNELKRIILRVWDSRSEHKNNKVTLPAANTVQSHYDGIYTIYKKLIYDKKRKIKHHIS